VTDNHIEHQLNVIEQALIELEAASIRGPDWYTRGRSGQLDQCSLWVHKARKAMDAIRENSEANKCVAISPR
jgi:hypothetical protein